MDCISVQFTLGLFARALDKLTGATVEGAKAEAEAKKATERAAIFILVIRLVLGRCAQKANYV